MTKPTLPKHARLPINRCNLPAVILGSQYFQYYPEPLVLDGITTLHAQLFESLDKIEDISERAENFKDYMRSSFLLDNLDEVGLVNNKTKKGRDRADYLRMLRGWLFDPNSKEAAVLKSWVESRFGLIPRNHNGPLGDFSNGDYSHNYMTYIADRSQGLYNTNALEAQLDLLFSFCQYEILRCMPAQTHLTLYRGTNRINEYEILNRRHKHHYTLLLNNLNSFTSQRERADEFGDYILQAQIPLSKILYKPGLLPGSLKGEDEYLVIGGVYEVEMSVF